MPPTADMTVPQVARMLGCSAPTVRALVAGGLLPAQASERGTRTFLTVRAADVDAYIAEHGTFTQRRGRGPSERTDLQPLIDEIAELRRIIEQGPSNQRETRAEVVALKEALNLHRAALAALQEADAARADGVSHLQRAMQAFETADTQRRTATQLLDEAIGSLTLPGDINGIET